MLLRAQSGDVLAKHKTTCGDYVLPCAVVASLYYVLT